MATKKTVALSEHQGRQWAVDELLRAAEEIDAIQQAVCGGAASALTSEVLMGTAERLRVLANGARAAERAGVQP